MLKNQGNPELSSGYSDGAYVWILHEEFNKLKARLLNLAETTSTNETQNEAMKGLIKDFTNQAYFGSLHKLEDYLRFFKVINGQSSASHTILEANSLKDILIN